MYVHVLGLKQIANYSNIRSLRQHSNNKITIRNILLKHKTKAFHLTHLQSYPT